MILVVAVALAARAPDVSAYPLRTSVVVSPSGATVTPLPPDIVGADPAALERTLWLTNADAALPFAVVTAPEGAPEVTWTRLRPTVSGAWEVDPLDEPASALVVHLEDATRPAEVRVTGPGVDVTEVLYTYDDELADDTVTIPPSRGPFVVSVRPIHDDQPLKVTRVDAEVAAPSALRPHTERFELGAPTITEWGRSRWVVPLPGPRTVTSIRLEVSDPIFDRAVWVAGSDALAGAHGPLDDDDLSTRSIGRVRRVVLGETHVDRVALGGLKLRGDTLVLEIDTNQGQPLPVAAVVVTSASAALVTVDPGAAQLDLYAAGPPTDAPWDLRTSVPAVLRAPHMVGIVGDVAWNASYRWVATRMRVDGPGSTLDLRRWRWARPIASEAGWTAVRLTPELLAKARPDLADLRVVDGEGRQVPSILARRVGEKPLTVGAIEREESGATTRLRIPIEPAGATVARLELRAAGPAFSREVSVLVDRGTTMETVRRVNWNALDQGGTIVIDVDRPVFGELLVHVDNGDDAPLTIESATATSPEMELRARVPEGGARLVYGNPKATAPDYDLAQFVAEMLRARVPAGTLGDETALAPVVSVFDGLATLAAVGILAVGLVVLTIRVVTGAGRVAET